MMKAYESYTILVKISSSFREEKNKRKGAHKLITDQLYLTLNSP